MENNPPKFLTDNSLRYVKEDVPVVIQYVQKKFLIQYLIQLNKPGFISQGTEVFQILAVDGDSGVKSPNQIIYTVENKGDQPK